MASSIASLFGPTAEEIVYDRNQQERIRQQTELQQSLAGQENQASRDFYQSGYNMAMGVGKGLSGMFGYTEQMGADPRIAKALKMRELFSNVSGEDLNDPAKLEAMGKLADEYDLPDFKLWAVDRAAAKRAAIAAAKPDIVGAGTTYADPTGREFAGGTVNGRIVEVDQATGNWIAAPGGSKKAVKPTKANKVVPPDAFTIEAVEDRLIAAGFDTGTEWGTWSNDKKKEFTAVTKEIAADSSRILSAENDDGRLSATDAVDLAIQRRLNPTATASPSDPAKKQGTLEQATDEATGLPIYSTTLVPKSHQFYSKDGTVYRLSEDKTKVIGIVK